MSETKLFDVTDFGSVGQGPDDTGTIQSAIDAAAAVSGTVFFPAGVYRCSTLKLHAHTGLIGQPTWSYYKPGGAVLKLINPDARCLLDIADTRGIRIDGLCLLGNQLGKHTHGIATNRQSKSETEDFPAIERTMVTGFTGDGIRLDQIWCFSMRGCAVGGNGGDGLGFTGADGYLIDNWFSGNQGAGIRATGGLGSSTITANRVEWNAGGGILASAAWHFNINGNCLDRNGGPSLSLRVDPNVHHPCYSFAVTGNTILRSGLELRGHKIHDDADRTNVRLEGCQGLTFTGNALTAGQNDRRHEPGEFSPRYGMVVENLQHSVVTHNTLWRGAAEQLILDRGGHDDTTLICDNPGSMVS